MLTAADRLVIRHFLGADFPMFKLGNDSGSLWRYHYGDIIFDRKKGWCIFSSEKILNILAKSFRQDFSEIKQFYCGDTNGVYDNHGFTIKIITPKLFETIRRDIGRSKTADVTGGILHKVEEAIKAASAMQA